MKNIWNWITSIQIDKLLHNGMAMRIAAIAILVFKLFGYGNIASCCYGCGAAFVISIAKEIYDEIKKKSSESSDWAADVIGMTEAALYSYIIMSL